MLTVVSQKGLRKSLFSLKPLGKLYSFLEGVCVCVFVQQSDVKDEIIYHWLKEFALG